VISLLPSSASSLPWTWALACTPARYLQLPLAPSIALALRSSDQRLVSEPLSGDAFNEAVEPVECMTGHIALVEPESELSHVTVEVLLADVVECTVDATLQDGPNGFDTVGRNTIADVLASRVIDSRVPIVEVDQPVVDTVLIGVDRRSSFNTVEDCALHGLWLARSTACIFVRPPRSRIPSTAALPAPPCRPGVRLSACLFFSLPPK